MDEDESGPGWRRRFPPRFALTFDEFARVSADVTAAPATTDRSDHPLSLSALLSSFMRLRRGEQRRWERTGNPHCRAASSATQRQRTRSQARSCHARPPTTLLRMCARTLVKGVLLLLLLLLWIMSSKHRSKKKNLIVFKGIFQLFRGAI